MAQTVKNLPAMQETWVPSPGWEDPLGKGTAIHTSILGEFYGQRNLASHSPWGRKESDMTERSTHLTHTKPTQLLVGGMY